MTGEESMEVYGMTFSGRVNVSQNGKSFKDARVRNAMFYGGAVYGWLDMRNTDFSGADMVNVVFNYCDLRGVNFDGAKFINVLFCRCMFDEVYISGKHGSVELAPFCKNGIRVDYSELVMNSELYYTFNSGDMSYPVETDGEELYGYKKVCVGELVSDLHCAIAKLRIPAYADRIVYKNDKCRASCAQVVDIYNCDGHHDTGESMLYSRKNCEYRVGHMVYADSFDDNPFEVCSNGIHFFLTEDEARCYRG